jgi:integrase
MTDTNGKPLYQKDGTPATENKLKVEQFTPHDLRRTAATFMGGMGFMDEIIDAVLNHVKQGINRLDLWRGHRTAMREVDQAYHNQDAEKIEKAVSRAKDTYNAMLEVWSNSTTFPTKHN